MIAGLLLAAGGATRFGSQKLLAPLSDGRPLVWRAARALRDSVDALVVVVGCDADAVSRALVGIDATIVVNDAWADGLSTSLRAGVRALPANATAVVVSLGDQPLVDPAVQRAVIAKWRTTGVPIVSARYAGTRGHPVLFARSIFDELERVTGDAGAREVILREAARVAYLDVNTAPPIDVDSPADLALLSQDRDPAARGLPVESTPRDQ